MKSVGKQPNRRLMNDEHDSLNAIRGMARRMKLLRLSQGYETQAAFSRATGIDVDTIGLWEKGGRFSISLANAAKLRSTTRATLDWLYFGDESSLPGSLLKELQEFKKLRHQVDIDKKRRDPAK